MIEGFGCMDTDFLFEPKPSIIRPSACLPLDCMNRHLRSALPSMALGLPTSSILCGSLQQGCSVTNLQGTRRLSQTSCVNGFPIFFFCFTSGRLATEDPTLFSNSFSATLSGQVVPAEVFSSDFVASVFFFLESKIFVSVLLSMNFCPVGKESFWYLLLQRSSFSLYAASFFRSFSASSSFAFLLSISSSSCLFFSSNACFFSSVASFSFCRFLRSSSSCNLSFSSSYAFFFSSACCLRCSFFLSSSSPFPSSYPSLKLNILHLLKLQSFSPLSPLF